MKNYIVLFLLSIFLISCEGSETYQGKWKALDKNGNKFEIIFKPKTFSVKDSMGKINQYEYSQNSFKFQNTVETYGIILGDGRAYQIYFPKNDESVGLILDENGAQIYTISRTNFMTYDDIYKLN